uniref:Ribosomal protein L29 n=1 Tax=Chondria sp. (in: red algae) TaxID=1982705 RepID=A0A1Z1MDP9_9FLOR|nr:ribosomal protein L29 [Chondria sp. (in: red algae)]
MNKELNKFKNTSNKNEEVFKLQRELIFLRMKQKTKQNIKTHILKKIKKEISQILTLST